MPFDRPIKVPVANWFPDEVYPSLLLVNLRKVQHDRLNQSGMFVDAHHPMFLGIPRKRGVHRWTIRPFDHSLTHTHPRRIEF